ncbi:hypothetical protein DPV78_009700 [Talaromyces pinophilus]|nr:hypothetical protein DPV78_009700 [Talaromyces pinophilus]
MAGFPTLKPAFTVRVSVDAPFPVGSHHRKTALVVVPMVGGTVISESGFTPALDAKFEGTGNDYIRNDPDGKRMRLNAHGVVKTHDDATGDERYKDLENGVFVGQGHFVTKTGEKTIVEYKVSQVLAG